MSKGKRVKGDFDNFDFEQNPDLFDDPELLDAYLDSLGVGKTEPTPRKSDVNAGIDFSKLGATEVDDSEDVGAQIADMLMSNMMGNSIQVEEKKTEKVQVSSNYGSPVLSQKSIGRADVSSVKDPKKKLRSNIALVRTPSVTGMRWLSIRDSFGNATAVPVSSDTVTVNPDDLDDYLDSIYVYRKITGMPVAVYSKEDFDERFLRKGIHNVDLFKFIFIAEPDMFGDDRILVYTVDFDEREEFKTYIKENLTIDEIAGSGLMITAIMRDTCCMLTNYSFAEYILNSVMEDETSKDKLEADILDDPHTNTQSDNAYTINIDFEKFSDYIESGFMHIAQTTINLDSSDEDSADDEDDVEEFDPYANQSTSDETEERKAEGASDDDGTFQDSDNEYDAAETIRISGEDSAPAGESDTVTESGTVSSGTVRTGTSDFDSAEKEEAEEDPGVQSEWGDRNASEFEEDKETEEVQNGDGHSEITEVDSETFNFEEEAEEKEEDSMVINVTTVGKE